MLHGIIVRLRTLLRPTRVGQEIDEELRQHVDARVEQLLAGGMSVEEARTAARRELGNLTAIREQSRDAIGVRWIDDGLRDVRYGLRGLGRTPLATAIIIVTLALGIGVNTSIFSILYGMFFRSPDVPEPGRLAWVVGRTDKGFRNLSYPEYLAYRDSADAFSSIAVYQDIIVALGGADGSTVTRLGAYVVSANYFEVLGLRPAAGRAFLPVEDTRSDGNPVVIGWSLWQRLFAGSADAVGTTIVLNGHSFTIVGVAPKGFTGLTDDRDMSGDVAWVPVATAAASPLLASYGGREAWVSDNHFWFRAVGRLAPNAAVERADAQVRTIAKRVADGMAKVPRGFSAAAVRVSGIQHPSGRDNVLETTVLLMAVPAMVLLIVCANVANLLLSRGATRRREMGVRRALGASRGRLLKQLLTESTVLAIAGGAAGFVISVWFSHLLLLSIDASTELRGAVRPDWTAAAFSALIVLATGVLCGLAPALGPSRSDLVTALKDDSAAAGRSRRRTKLTSTFVVIQVTAAMALLMTTGLFLRSLQTVSRVDVGFETRNALTATVDLSLLGYDNLRSEHFLDELLERVRALPDVQRASITSSLPLVGPDNTAEVVRAEQRTDRTVARVKSGIAFIRPDYFRTMAVPLVAGRDFSDRDDGAAALGVIVNETLARRLWPDNDVLGRQLAVPSIGGSREEIPVLEIIGVVRDHKYRHLAEEQYPVMYVADRQHARLGGGYSRVTLIARTVGSEAGAIASVRAILRDLDPGLPLYNVHTVRELVEREIRPWSVVSSLIGASGTFAVLLMALGLYAIMSSTVTERRREIGVRMALGASRRAVLNMIMRDGLRLTSIGVVIGVPVSAALAQLVERFLYNVTTTDPATFVAVALLLAVVALTAGSTPARRAASVDPMVTLRAE